MILKIWNRYVNREAVRYLFFGVLTTLTDWIVYTVCWRLGMDYRVSTAVSWCVAVLFAFVTNKLYVFQSRDMEVRLLWKELVSFVGCRAATGAFTMVAMIVMVDAMHLNEFIGKLVTSAISLVLNYLFSKRFIFRSNHGLEDVPEDDVKQCLHRKLPRSSIRPADGLLAAFLVPVIVMIIIFVQRGIFPFGEESFLRTDMYHQYAPFFSEFQHKLQTGGSLLYSWDMGMGVNFSALYAYYLASPLNWLIVLCPKDYIIEFMTYSIVLKIGLSGLTFAYYLRRHGRTSDFGVAFFGIFYALSGYMAAYSWNIMWLDCILLFPLIMLGLERLVKEKKCFLYCITLGLSILSNYYISIMICIFMVMYFAVLLILEKKKSFRDYLWNIAHFGIYSLAAGGLAAVVLLPEIFALKATASGNFNFPKDVKSYFSIFDMFARHMGNVNVEIGLDHWPNIYCGVAVLIFFLLYVTCKKISVKEKVVYCGLLLLFYASFSLNILNFIWHGFHYPNSLPSRQSFIYIFLMLFLSYRAYQNLKHISWKHISIAFLGAVCFVVLAEKLVDQKHFEFYIYYVAILFLAAYAGLLYLYKHKRLNYNLLMVLVLGLVAVEAAVNTTITSVTTTSRTAYMNDNKEVQNLIGQIPPEDEFHRVEKVTRKTKNDGAWMNFPSVSIFSSTAHAGLTAFFKDIGCEGNTNAYSITGSTPLADSLFSVKYGLYSERQVEDGYLSMVRQSGDTFLYERNDTLPLGFMVDEQFEDQWQTDSGNPAQVQNDLCDAVGAQPVLIEALEASGSSTISFIPEISGDYYAYVTNRNVEEVTVSKGEDSETFKNVNRGYLLEFGYCEAGAEVVIKSGEDDQNVEMRVYRFDYAGLHSVYRILNQYPLTITHWSDAKVEGQVTAAQNGILFTSIPYDKGWNVLVDGVRQEPREMFGAFLGIGIAEGTHSITLLYRPEGLLSGLWITGLSVLFLLLMWWMDHWNGKYDTRWKRGEKTMKLWGGRFTKETSQLVHNFNESLSFDQKLYHQDIDGSIAHVTMLAKQGIVSGEDEERIIAGLEGIRDDIEDGRLVFTREHEDIHSFVEAHLIERIGEAGKRLHTGRSRNDQVALDMKLYCREEIGETDGLIRALLEELLKIMEDHTDTYMPGFTHLQKAQPTTLAHHMGAYFEMFSRDRSRLRDIKNRMNYCPLGSGALAGTTYPLDRDYTADLLGFYGPTRNSMDSVADRDYVIELLSALSTISMHLSRFCEEIILWNSNEYRFVEIDDAYSTGSSIMPQKKNPDIAELVRGKTGRVYGALVAVLTTMKGLPLAYNKDMQEDKELTFDAIDTVKGCLALFTGMISTMTFQTDVMEASAKNGFTNATDAADYLVNHGVPFRDAHGIVGQLVLYCIERDQALDDMTLEEFQAISPVFEQDIYEAISMETCVKKRMTLGAPGQEAMKQVIAWYKEELRDQDH